jgi:hypothetical protein
MVVLLVYRHENIPATLVLHGMDSTSWLSMASPAGQRNEPHLETAIRRVLAPRMGEVPSWMEVASEVRSAD